jgi:hypothetical protein
MAMRFDLGALQRQLRRRANNRAVNGYESIWRARPARSVRARVQHGSKPQLRESGVIVGAPPERPVILPIRFLDGKVVDASEPALH